jgi:hypothetical protein
MRLRTRYVNTKVVEHLSRPQYDWSCSMTALTGVVNYLYSKELGVQTQESVARSLGMNIEDIGTGGGPGNDTIINARF